MDYFEHLQPDQGRIDTSLSGIKKLVQEFYIENNSDPNIRLHSSTLGADELLSFVRAYMNGNITLGFNNDLYEKQIQSIFNCDHAVSSNSGSSANLLAISCLIQAGKLSKGDYVAVPALAWSTTIFPIVQYGLIPIYIDACPKSFNIDADKLACAANEYDIKAVMLIHTYGNPASLDKIINLCIDKNIILIEDTCESMGAKWNGQNVGTYGLLGTYSTYYSHHICTLEGGITVTNNSELMHHMKSIRSHGWTRGTNLGESVNNNEHCIDPTFCFVDIGYNLRLSDPQAAIGCVQIQKLETYVKNRQNAANRFIDNISNSGLLSKFIHFQQVDSRASSSWFGFPVFIPNISHDQVAFLRSNLKKNNIESRPFLAGNFSFQPVNKKFKSITPHPLEFTSKLHASSFALPCHQSITIEQVDKMTDSLQSLLSQIL